MSKSSIELTLPTVKPLTENQRNITYTEDLKALMLKISKISLYDSITANEFLSEYNELIKNETELGQNIFEKIVNLEEKIKDYEKEKGRAKELKERNKAILEQLDELQNNYLSFSLEDFQSIIEHVRKKYNDNIYNYDFEDRGNIESKIYSLQALLIIRQIKFQNITELQDIISEEDIRGLTIFINEQVSKFLQAENENIKAIAIKIRNIIFTDNEAIYNQQIWKLLDKGIIEDKELDGKQEMQPTANTISTTSNNLPQVKKETSIVKKIMNVFKKNPIPTEKEKCLDENNKCLDENNKCFELQSLQEKLKYFSTQSPEKY